MVFLNLQIFPHKAKVQNKVKSNFTKPWLNIIDTNLGVVYSEESSGALAVEILGLQFFRNDIRRINKAYVTSDII